MSGVQVVSTALGLASAPPGLTGAPSAPCETVSEVASLIRQGVSGDHRIEEVPVPGDEHGGLRVTVADLLAEELLHGSLAAGGLGTSHVVEWCVPGSPLLAKESDLQDVRSAAVFVSSAELEHCAAEAVPRLAEHDAAALLAWPGAHGHHPDHEEARAAADAVGLPLLLLPPAANFRNTSQLIGTKVLAQSTHVLEYGTRVHRQLGDVFAKGAGLGGLTETMARISGAEVLVLSQAGELIASAHAPRQPRLSKEEAQQVIEQLLLVDFSRGQGGVEAHPRIVTLVRGEGSRDVVVTQVLVAGQTYGLLALVEPTSPTPEHTLAQHVVLAEQGVSLTGSELLRQQSVREAEERARNDFVHALLHSRFTDHLELAARAEHYHFELDGRFAVFIISSPEIKQDDASSRRRAVDVARAARSGIADDGLSLSALIGPMIVVVTQIRAQDPRKRDAHQEPSTLREFGERLNRMARQRLGDDIRVAFGRGYDGAAGVSHSYREARTAEALGKRVNAPTVCAYEDMRLYAALQESAASPAGQAFAEEILTPLNQSDGQTGNLEAVVMAYIEEAGNLNATARRLHLHRNTMLYKLERASRALGMDIRTTDAQFKVWLAQHIAILGDIDSQLDEELTPPT